MSCFESADELKPYVEVYLEYNRIVEQDAGLHLPPYGYALFINDNGRPIFYIIQKRMFGFVILRYNFAFLWFLLNMLSVRMVSFPTITIICAIIAAGLALVVNPPHRKTVS